LRGVVRTGNVRDKTAYYILLNNWKSDRIFEFLVVSVCYKKNRLLIINIFPVQQRYWIEVKVHSMIILGKVVGK
jgi:hypothetical protein